MAFDKGALLLVVGTICTLQLGCLGHVQVKRAALDQLPLIDELVPNPRGDCKFVRIGSPHTVRVCVIGSAESIDGLLEILPFLSDYASVPGADSLSIPEILLENGESLFGSSDPFWMCKVDSLKNARSFSVYCGFSSSSGRYYLEYRWGQ
mgnify:CR=1 FL=1